MNNEAVEKAAVALFCWREASQYGGDRNMLAIACVLRNRVRSRGTPWLEVLQNASGESFRLHQPLQDKYPDLREPSWLRFFRKIDGIFSGQEPDITSCEATIPAGRIELGRPMAHQQQAKVALYWAIPSEVDNPWFKERIIGKPEHPRTAVADPFWFFA